MQKSKYLPFALWFQAHLLQRYAQHQEDNTALRESLDAQPHANSFPYTVQKIRQLLEQHFWMMEKYWMHVKHQINKTIEEHNELNTKSEEEKKHALAMEIESLQEMGPLPDADLLPLIHAFHEEFLTLRMGHR